MLATSSIRDQLPASFGFNCQTIRPDGVTGQDNHRFISSRKSANGPTLGDTNGKSLLDGTGLYAKSFRAARRF